MKTVAVFFGGKSVEHDISIITGVMAANSIDRTLYSVIPVYVDKNGAWFTGESLLDLDAYKNLDYKKLVRVAIVGGENALYAVKKSKLKELARVTCALNCMHGERGEDGSLSGLLNMCLIPCASPQILASAVSIDKRFTKTVLKGLGVKTLPCKVVKSVFECDDITKKIQFPVIVKPNLLGSSIGISKVKDTTELKRAVSYALLYGESAVVEKCLENFTEINCAAYMRADGSVRVSECERPIGRSEVLSFGDKYRTGKRVFPADIDKSISDKIKKITEKVYVELGVIGVVRIDYFVVGSEVYLNEINSVPGSLAYYLFGDTLKSFTLMLNELFDAADKKYAYLQSVKTDYNSGVLSSLGGKGAKANKKSN